MLDRVGDAVVMFRRAQDIARAEQRRTVDGPTGVELSPLSPWATKRHLATIAFADETFGAGRYDRPVTVAEALRVPAIKKGRALLHSVLCSAPLVAIRNTAGVDTVLTGKDAPTWLYRSDTDIAPEQRMAGVLDDLIFHEASLLAVKRGSVPDGETRGNILDAVHVPYEWWTVDDEGRLLVDDMPASTDDYVWIPGPSAGLLVDARSEIRQWLDIARNIHQRLGTPTPSILLEDSDTGDVDEDEIEDMVRRVAQARRSPDGGVMYVPAGIKATPVASNDDSALYIEARNALRIDIANHMNLPVSLLDGSPATASLTYSTGEGKRSEFDDLSVDYWTTPIESALSQDLVVPRSTRIRFDFASRYAPTNAPTGAPTQD
jgi:hypothetical protein